MNFTLKFPQNKKYIKQLFTRLEIYFWASLINLMSESVLVQRVVHKAHNTRLLRHHMRFILKAMAISGAGLLLGFVAGFLSAQ
jgi:uncharacterized membrane protein